MSGQDVGCIRGFALLPLYNTGRVIFFFFFVWVDPFFFFFFFFFFGPASYGPQFTLPGWKIRLGT